MSDGKIELLIVDDEPNIRLMLRTTLDGGDYRLREAGTSAEAIEAIEQLVPHVIVLDLRMPLVSGMTVLEYLRQRTSGPRPRAIVLTAHGSASLAMQAIRLGAFDFLEKPLKPDELRTSVAAAVAEPLAEPPVVSPPVKAEMTHEDVLRLVRKEITQHNYRSAEMLLAKVATGAQSDPACLNLLGVLHESEGRGRVAKKFYNLALSIDPNYEAAKQNLRRLYELESYGTTTHAVAMGGEARLTLSSPS